MTMSAQITARSVFFRLGSHAVSSSFGRAAGVAEYPTIGGNPRLRWSRFCSMYMRGKGSASLLGRSGRCGSYGHVLRGVHSPLPRHPARVFPATWASCFNGSNPPPKVAHLALGAQL